MPADPERPDPAAEERRSPKSTPDRAEESADPAEGSADTADEGQRPEPAQGEGDLPPELTAEGATPWEHTSAGEASRLTDEERRRFEGFKREVFGPRCC